MQHLSIAVPTTLRTGPRGARSPGPGGRQAEFYLESAIRTAPGGPFARTAYALLEQEILADYSGSAGDHLPAEVQGRLTGLANLIAGAEPSP